jgi:hypothetical protein
MSIDSNGSNGSSGDIDINDYLDELERKIEQMDYTLSKKNPHNTKDYLFGAERAKIALERRVLASDLHALRYISKICGSKLCNVLSYIENEKKKIQVVCRVKSYNGSIQYEIPSSLKNVTTSCVEKIDRIHHINFLDNTILRVLGGAWCLNTKITDEIHIPVDHFFYYDTWYKYKYAHASTWAKGYIVKCFIKSLACSKLPDVYRQFRGFKWQESMDVYLQLIGREFSYLLGDMREDITQAALHDLTYAAIMRRTRTILYRGFVLEWNADAKKDTTNAVQRCAANALFERNLLWVIVDYLQ